MKCYLVKAEIKNAKSRRGIRCALFKMAQEFQAFYDESQSIYNDNEITLLFKTEGKAMEFGNHLSLWHYNNPLTARGLGISVDRSPVAIYN